MILIHLRCINITEVVHRATYSGHYRQVVFLHKWSLRQVLLSVYSRSLRERQNCNYSHSQVHQLINLTSCVLLTSSMGCKGKSVYASLTVRSHLSAPQISCSLTFHSGFYWNKYGIILLYTILLLPHLSSSLTSSTIFIQNRCVRISEVSLYTLWYTTQHHTLSTYPAIQLNSTRSMYI